MTSSMPRQQLKPASKITTPPPPPLSVGFLSGSSSMRTGRVFNPLKLPPIARSGPVFLVLDDSSLFPPLCSCVAAMMLHSPGYDASAPISTAVPRPGNDVALVCASTTAFPKAASPSYGAVSGATPGTNSRAVPIVHPPCILDLCWPSLFKNKHRNAGKYTPHKFDIVQCHKVSIPPSVMIVAGTCIWKGHLVGFFLGSNLPYLVVSYHLK